MDGESCELTPTEFRLLYALAQERGRVMTRDELLQRIWGRRETHRDRTVDVFVRRLREKIDRRAPRHTFIQTRYGVGYKLDPERKDVSPPQAAIAAPIRPTVTTTSHGGSRQHSEHGERAECEG